MLAIAHTATPWGIDSRSVDVEVDLRNGLPGIQIVGLPDAAVRESRERVQAAIRNSGVRLPPRAVVINLAPADLRKAGNHLDLPIALALLAAHDVLPIDVLEGRTLCGELALDGSVREIRGALAIAELAVTMGASELIVPQRNAGEAALREGVSVIGVQTLAEAIEHLMGVSPIEPTTVSQEKESASPIDCDLSTVRGQMAGRRALEIAAAGGHNLLMIGPPGSGKTLLSRCLPGILPPLSPAESLLVTRIHSVAGRNRHAAPAVRRPFRAPHASVSLAGLIGGGGLPRPGEITLAHHGVLFLDELPEFRRDAVEALRQPLEDGIVTVVRARASLTFPASFTLVASMNPCPCGHLGDPRRECTCSGPQVARYRSRVSGPLLDRIDLHVEVPAVSLQELKAEKAESSDRVAARVMRARRVQECRQGTAAVNADLSDDRLQSDCRLERSAQQLLDEAFERLGLSARALTRILKVARTIADLAGQGKLATEHVAEAIQYRSLDRRLD